jgi:hypothetical protein
MSFGLRNAAQTFQRYMDEVLRGLDFCFAYLNDILVFSHQSKNTSDISELSSAVFRHTGSSLTRRSASSEHPR